ncbi:MAG TPA: hypothetical protein VEW03_05475 [Longimicrobiaceae bacterium]|nr:hypothetical protein [Longimicrobiaceae bacterium]
MITSWFLPLLGLLWVGPACALPVCTCAPPATVENAIARADAVFLGTVTGTRDTTLIDADFGRMRARIYAFQIESSWKGVMGGAVEVMTMPSTASCGLRFRRGGEYLVYAHADRGSGESAATLTTGLCTRTKRRVDAAVDLEALGIPKQS